MVSVIMPVYNSIPYLKDAIEDVLYQSYEDIELICIDDGSNDDSLDVIQYFAKKDGRIKVLQQRHKGVGEARNYGMDNSSGDFLIFLDSDDRYSEDMIGSMVRKLDETGADIALCDAIIFDTKTKLKMDNSWILRTDKIPSLLFSPEECKESLFQITSGMPWNKMYRAEFVRRSGIRFQNIPYWNDTYFSFLLMVTADKIAVESSKFVAYRVGDSCSITGSSKIDIYPKFGFALLEKIHQYMIDKGVYDYYKTSYSKFVIEKFLYIVSHINENNYHVIFPYISADYLDQFGVGLLNENDFMDSEQFFAYKCLKTIGRDAFLCRELGTAVKAYEYCYKEMYTKNLIMMGDLKDLYYFDIPKVIKEKRIVLYGAGVRGRRINNLIKKCENTIVVAWVDKDYINISSEEGDITSPNDIQKYSYDYILIAVDRLHTMKDIKEKLIEQGVESNRIVW